MTQDELKIAMEHGKAEGLLIGELRALRASVDSIQKTLREFQNQIWQRVEDNSTAIKVLEKSDKAFEEEFKEIRDARKWFIRLILSVVFLAILGLIIKLR